MQTSYQKDFIWPSYLTKKETTHAITPELETAREGNLDKDVCEKERRRAVKKTDNPEKEKTLDEEKFEAVPEYLVNLFKKYPHLHHFYQQAGEEQLMKRIDNELYKTSYQIDFGQEGHVANDDYDELIEIAEALRSKRTKACQAEVHGDVGRRLSNNCTSKPMETCTCEDEPGVVKLAMKPTSISKMPRVPREKRETEGDDQQSPKGESKASEKTKPASEYKDTYEKLANIIIKKKLHYKRPDVI